MPDIMRHGVMEAAGPATKWWPSARKYRYFLLLPAAEGFAWRVSDRLIKVGEKNISVSAKAHLKISPAFGSRARGNDLMPTSPRERAREFSAAIEINFDDDISPC